MPGKRSITKCRANGLERCKQMSEGFIRSCKNRLANIISMDRVADSDDCFSPFSAAVLNMHSHDHTSEWCTHDKVHNDGGLYIENVQH